MLVAATDARAVVRTPTICAHVPASRLCAIHYHHRRVDRLRRVMGQRPIPYRWLAERSTPARRARILSGWVRVHKRTSARYRRWLRTRVSTPWSRSWSSDAACIRRYEGGWTSISLNGLYFGAYQADVSFQQTYNPAAYRRWGTANHWPPIQQTLMAWRGWKARGWEPWPVSSARCGL